MQAAAFNAPYVPTDDLPLGAQAPELPALGLALQAKLSFFEPLVGVHALPPCVTPECGCLGVFYTRMGGNGQRLCLDVGVADMGLPSSEVAAQRTKAVELFRASPPSVDLFYNGCGESASKLVHIPVEDVQVEWVPSAETEVEGGGRGGGHDGGWETVGGEGGRGGRDGERGGRRGGGGGREAGVAGGVWRILFRARENTDRCLAQCRVRVGPNVLLSGGFEVRTKPAEWILLQPLPRALRDRRTVSAFLEDCVEAEMAHKKGNRPQGASASVRELVVVSHEPMADAAHAFVRLQNRTQANFVVQGWRRLRGMAGARRQYDEEGAASDSDEGEWSGAATPASAGGGAGGARRARRHRVARVVPANRGLSNNSLGWADECTVSFLGSLNKLFTEDPSLRNVPVPDVAMASPTFLQREDGIAGQIPRPRDAENADHRRAEAAADAWHQARDRHTNARRRRSEEEEEEEAMVEEEEEEPYVEDPDDDDWNPDGRQVSGGSRGRGALSSQRRKRGRQEVTPATAAPAAPFSAAGEYQAASWASSASDPTLVRRRHSASLPFAEDVLQRRPKRPRMLAEVSASTEGSAWQSEMELADETFEEDPIAARRNEKEDEGRVVLPVQLPPTAMVHRRIVSASASESSGSRSASPQ